MFSGPDPATVNPAVCIRYLMDVLPKPSEYRQNELELYPEGEAANQRRQCEAQSPLAVSLIRRTCGW